MISLNGIGFDLWMVGQIIIAFILYKSCKKYLDKITSINTLVLMPIAPTLALVLYVLTRVKNRNYYRGYIYLLPLLLLVLIMKDMGPTIYVFSILITSITYSCFEYSRLEDEGNIYIRLIKSMRPIIISLVIGKLCKGMNNPISFIISCNLLSDYILQQFTKTNKWKWSRERYDSENGNNWNILAGFMEAVFVGSPTDLVGRSKPIVDGLSDALCIINLLVNNSQRGVAGVVVTNWADAIIFFTLLVIIYIYSNITNIKEVDKIWPPVMTYNVPHISKFELLVVSLSLTFSYTLSSTTLFDASLLLSKLAIVTMLCMFARIKVVTSMFFTANVLL